MSLAEPILMELEYEAATTRKLLERVPEDKFDWKPHEKSMTFGRLASHIAEMYGWCVGCLGQKEMVIDPETFKPFNATSHGELMETFDNQLEEAKGALKKATDEALMEHWKLFMGQEEVIDMPRLAVIRTWVLNHVVHHRGQLSVYLRENNIPVPAIYGPSADEQA